MKINFTIYCHEHPEELEIIGMDTDSQETVTFHAKPCSQCMSESYEKGIESLLSKQYTRGIGE